VVGEHSEPTRREKGGRRTFVPMLADELIEA